MVTRFAHACFQERLRWELKTSSCLKRQINSTLHGKQTNSSLVRSNEFPRFISLKLTFTLTFKGKMVTLQMGRRQKTVFTGPPCFLCVWCTLACLANTLPISHRTLQLSWTQHAERRSASSSSPAQNQSNLGPTWKASAQNF